MTDTTRPPLAGTPSLLRAINDRAALVMEAVDGLVAHVMYEGVTTPFTINGVAGNQPE